MRLLKINSLPGYKTWIDKDFIMLHACFQILVDAVEKEGVHTHVDYDVHKQFVDEINILYKWWLTRKDINDHCEEDDNMLLRLMKIRTQLWT